MRLASTGSARRLLVAGALLATLALVSGVAGSTAAVTPKQQAVLDAQATKLIRNGRYVGTRGDGYAVDMTFCANGKYRSDVDGGVSTGKKWLVRRSTSTKDGFTAIIAENKDRRKGGYAVAIAKRGTKWFIGIESFDTATKLGSVVRKAAGAECPAA